jgi:hypothetical protein
LIIPAYVSPRLIKENPPRQRRRPHFTGTVYEPGLSW